MLVLTRKPGERIMIGDNIEITVIATDGAKVRLGIAAPIEIPVHRTEIYEAIQEQRGNSGDSEQHKPAPAPSK